MTWLTPIFPHFQHARGSLFSRNGRSSPTASLRAATRHRLLHDSKGQLTDTIGTYPNGRWGTVGDERGSPGLYPLFESFTRVHAAGSRLVIGHGSEPELSIFDATAEPRLMRLVRWTTGPRTVSPEDAEAERRRLAERYDDMDPDMRRRLVEPLVSDERPVANQFPAFAGVMLGRDGRIWVREYARPDGPDTHTWVAFDSGGRFECRATLPFLGQVLEFGEDYLLALDRDDLDIERIVGLAIGPAAEGQ